VGVIRALNRSAELISAAVPLNVLPLNFNRYTPTHPSYGLHTDCSLRWLPDGSALRTDLSATLFLSSPDEYEGGELNVEYTYGRLDIKLPTGSLVLYPSGAIHVVHRLAPC
jgi:PKHD-type hydroxylase